MPKRALSASWSALRQIWWAIRARPKLFLAVLVAVFALNLFLPPLVLSLVRKPWDYFAFNAWLPQLPHWLVSPEATLRRKVTFLWDLALFWFIADSPYDAPEWGFSVSVRDLVRWLFVSGLFGAYFALWAYIRTRPAGAAVWRGGRRDGVLGAVVSTLGLSTAPCSVMGCGAPVLPVLGLAFQGLTSGTLAGLAMLSNVANVVVQVGMTLVVLTMGRLADLSDSNVEHGGNSRSRNVVGAPIVRN